jgi:hypothetical protein
MTEFDEKWNKKIKNDVGWIGRFRGGIRSSGMISSVD